MFQSKLGALLCGASAALAVCGAAQAEVFGGVNFPGGISSFADAMISYQPGLAGGDPSAAYQGPLNALGAPDFGSASCASAATCDFVSLGVGGVLILQFTDNVLTGSNSTADDLWIFEVGPDVEDTTVDVSTDGLTWLSVGLVTGSTRGIDIDAFGFDATSAFSFVRLTDVANEGGTGSGGSVGADIDAIGAISTRAVQQGVPEPGTWALMIAGFGLAGGALRRRRTVGA